MVSESDSNSSPQQSYIEAARLLMELEAEAGIATSPDVIALAQHFVHTDESEAVVDPTREGRTIEPKDEPAGRPSGPAVATSTSAFQPKVVVDGRSGLGLVKAEGQVFWALRPRALSPLEVRQAASHGGGGRYDVPGEETLYGAYSRAAAVADVLLRAYVIGSNADTVAAYLDSAARAFLLNSYQLRGPGWLIDADSPASLGVLLDNESLDEDVRSELLGRSGASPRIAEWLHEQQLEDGHQALGVAYTHTVNRLWRSVAVWARGDLGRHVRVLSSSPVEVKSVAAELVRAQRR